MCEITKVKTAKGREQKAKCAIVQTTAMTRMLRKPSWFPKPWLHQQQTKKAVNKSKDAGWSQQSNNIQGLHQDQDVIPRLNERRYEEEKKEKGKKKSKGTWDIRNW